MATTEPIFVTPSISKCSSKTSKVKEILFKLYFLIMDKHGSPKLLLRNFYLAPGLMSGWLKQLSPEPRLTQARSTLSWHHGNLLEVNIKSHTRIKASCFSRIHLCYACSVFYTSLWHQHFTETFSFPGKCSWQRRWFAFAFQGRTVVEM